MAVSVGEHIVLIVDDKSSVRQEAMRTLRGAGYQALEAASLAQARRMLAAPVSAVLVADELPDGGGAELIASLRVPALVLASSHGSSAAAQALTAGAKGSLNRQRPTDDLLPTLRRVLAATGTSASDARKAPRKAAAPSLPVAEPQRPGSAPATTPDSPDDAAARVLLSALEKELAFLRKAGHYRVLGVSPTASTEELRAAFERFRTKWHPSRLSDEATSPMRALAGEIFALGQQAFTVLADPGQRSNYKAPPTILPRSGKKPRPAPQAVREKPAMAPLPVAEPRELFGTSELPPLPEGEDPDLHDAREKLRKGDAAGAQGALRKVLTRKPASKPASALAHVAEALAKVEDEETAIREIDQALDDDPDCVEAIAVKEELAEKRAVVLDRISSDKISRKAVGEVAVLAFSNSALKEIVGTDALRTVIGMRYIEMVRTPGVLDLSPLWDILAAQPGFAMELARPPLCRIKLWEKDIGAEVKLPPALGDLSLIDAHKHAADCRVPEGELERALSGANAPAAATATPRPIGAAGAIKVTGSETVAERKKRGIAIYAFAGAVALLIGSIVYTFGGSIVKTLQATDVSTEIPATTARKAGECIGLVLPDRAWLSQPEDVRRKQMEDALDRARALGSGGVVVMDPEQKIIASASSEDGKVTVTFSPVTPK